MFTAGRDRAESAPADAQTIIRAKQLTTGNTAKLPILM
jgi:hypothetical protein